ncbi:Imm26 family immunity protein [Sphingobium sp. CR28]|uniref:Imm26 family immunity protein n=1 Tax=Sphingobium sp. CR28 TaxID=3400272 RepID=UPI003FEEDE44
MMTDSYPYIPRSTAKLQPGDFWSIPLSDGSYSCGLVLQLAPKDEAGSRVTFCGALLNWHGEVRPSTPSLGAPSIVAQGIMHIMAITKTGGEIEGNLEAERRPRALLWHDGGRRISEGYNYVRPWSVADREVVPAMEFWSWSIISRRAETHFQIAV